MQIDMDIEPVQSSGLSPRVHGGEVTEMHVIDSILQTLPRMMKADRKIRSAFFDQSAASIAILIRDQTDAIRRERAIVVDGHLSRSRALHQKCTEEFELRCRRELLQTRAQFVAHLIEDAATACAALSEHDTMARELIAEFYDDEIAHRRATWKRE